MIIFYRSFTLLASPLIPLWLKVREARGKEDGARLGERMGRTKKARPDGKLVWLHAASVGEANAVLPLIDAILATSSSVHVLLTTVTVTSSTLMQSRLPGRAIHQFAPVDTPQAVGCFLAHWHPDAALWVDSELWPNMLMMTRARGIVMGLINARLSERSFRRWSMARGVIGEMLRCFTLCFAQTKADAERLRTLGMRTINGVGNLKYDAPELPFDAYALAQLQTEIGDRPLWLAASTHPGEETIAASVHTALKNEEAKPLTVIVPRHAVRGDAIAAQLAPLIVARRSLGDAITPATDIYLADTMGELGLFYRLSHIAFIGKSFAGGGGQNPLEAARIGCAVITGPLTANFAEIYATLKQANACLRVENQGELVLMLRRLLQGNEAAALGEKARACVKAQAGVVSAIMNELRPNLV